MIPEITPSPDKPKRRLRLGLAVSIVVHSCLLTVLVFIPYRLWVSSHKNPAQNGDSGQVAQGEETGSPQEKPGKIPVAKEVADEAEKVMADRAEAELQTALNAAEQLSDEEKLARLQQLGGKLNKVSSEESVNELSKKLQGWLGTKERAAAPAEKPTGDFDYGTAQFHDIKREELPDGTFVYKTVLLDAAGRTVETDLDADEGERTYNTLSILKANPLLEKLYRQATMPLLDKLIKAAEQAAEQIENATLTDPTPPRPTPLPSAPTPTKVESETSPSK